jgi:hypothetical protein
MPNVAVSQLAKAIDSLTRFHPFFGVTFLSMKKTGVNVTSPTIWGSSQEEALLRGAFAPPGAPAGKKYFVPFGRAEEETGFWRNPKYSGGSLQSARTRQKFSQALVRVSTEQWKFEPNYVATLASLLPRNGSAAIRLPVFDLAAWLYKDIELPNTLPEVEAKFRSDFNLADANEYAVLFDASQPNPGQFFSPDPISRDDLIGLTQGVPEGPSLNGRTETDLVQHLKNWIRDRAKLALPDTFVEIFYTALKAQRFVVLAGRPGTGKTAFVRAFYKALSDFFENTVQLVEVSVAQEFSEADVIGYEKISGGLAATELSRKMFLSGRPNDIYVVLLDEMNLAHVDHYLARLLPSFESDSPVELPGESVTKNLPPDAFLVGTINSFIEENTRLPLSGPVKRRANVIEMPNFLESLVTNGQRADFDKTCIGLLQQTKDRITDRRNQGLGSVLDEFRINSLDSAMAAGSSIRGAELMDPLWEICSICCSETTTSPTFGIIQDVLDYVAMSPNNIARSLGEQIAHKIVPQLNGPARVARELLAAIDGFDHGTGNYSSAVEALEALLQSEDSASGLVMYRY